MPILNFVATEPNRLAMVPFAVLLLAIALGPLIARHHWERHYHKLCLALAGIVCFYYLLVLKQPARVVHAGMEYATFMVVVGAFFVVAGGIQMRAKAPSSPLRNTVFLLAGAVLGSLIGTIALVPDLLRPLSEAGAGKGRKFRIAGLRDGWAWAPRQWSKVTDDTGTGNPVASTPQKGEKFLQAVMEKIGAFLVDLAAADLDDMYE